MENKESDLRGDTSPNEFKQILQVRKIYDHYLKYFFSCMRAILEFENRNIAKFENFRTKFFIDINQSFEYSSSALKNNLYAENDFETLLYIADRRWEIGDQNLHFTDTVKCNKIKYRILIEVNREYEDYK